MIKTALFFLALMTSISVAGQECEYAEYFRLTDLAKEQVSMQQFKKARLHFESAFAQTDFPLGHDLSFALFVADQTKDDAWAGSLAALLAKGGVQLRYFSKFKKRKWYPSFAQNFDAFAAYYRQHFQPEMKTEFLELLQNDLAFNETYHQWREGKIELEVEGLIAGATEIATAFRRFTGRHGYPTEQKMGYYYIRGKNRVEEFPVAALLIHLKQLGDNTIEQHIHPVVCEGGMRPMHETTLKRIQGYGNGTGIDQEMQARYAKYGPSN